MMQQQLASRPLHLHWFACLHQVLSVRTLDHQSAGASLPSVAGEAAEAGMWLMLISVPDGSGAGARGGVVA